MFFFFKCLERLNRWVCWGMWYSYSYTFLTIIDIDTDWKSITHDLHPLWKKMSWCWINLFTRLHHSKKNLKVDSVKQSAANSVFFWRKNISTWSVESPPWCFFRWTMWWASLERSKALLMELLKQVRLKLLRVFFQLSLESQVERPECGGCSDRSKGTWVFFNTFRQGSI